MLDTIHAFYGGLEPMVKARRFDAFARQCKFFSVRPLIFLTVYSSSSIFLISFAIFLQGWILSGKGP